MTLSAHVTLDGDELVAKLSDGREIRATEPFDIAMGLLAAKVPVNQVRMGVWWIDGMDVAPPTGDKIAIFYEMRQALWGT